MSDRRRAPSIEQATSERHVRAVAPVFDAYRVFYGFTPDPQAAYAFLRDRWTARESVLFFARDDDDEILGFVHLYPLFLSGAMRRFWLLNDLYVVEAARRRGVARALMRRAERHARETSSGGLTLSTAVSNLGAQALYESEGYGRDAEFLTYVKEFA